MKLGINEAHASYFKRAVAYLIDALIIDLVIFLPLQKTIEKLETNVGSALLFNIDKVKGILPELSIIFFATAIITIAYWSLLEYYNKQSIGKAAMGIYVRSEEKSLSLKQCIVRNLSKFSLILLLIDCIGLFSDRRRFLEKISNTLVVEKRFKL